MAVFCNVFEGNALYFSGVLWRQTRCVTHVAAHMGAFLFATLSHTVPPTSRRARLACP